MPRRPNLRKSEQLSDFEKRCTIGLIEICWSNKRIDRLLRPSNVMVARCWQQLIKEGIIYRCGGSGRPRNKNACDDRAIIRAATSSPTTSLDSVRRYLPPSRHPVVLREPFGDEWPAQV
ncbi:uncharacterized protein TNCV_2723051 [Trichonephila clavipes]|nr:uncharacterized protein TNCV_2723051 [Trichonephila clavipes]